ncbi:DUF4124 domain-containing protein [Massilia sp. S19_KUP03_FR1]|uniref:DUF4124 domain-containing protein n=1 Tax=Massilia sp. S19_KUP03_FR1 TaxID=3025503 RepID=UPI002FCD8A68
MKRHALTNYLLLAAAAGAFALPAAQAGGAINKCIDGTGRVTLTDQVCDAHTVTSAIVVPGTQADEAVLPASVPARAVAVRQARWMPAAGPVLAPHAALSGDMATLRQARVQLLLQDAAPRTRLAAR